MTAATGICRIRTLVGKRHAGGNPRARYRVIALATTLAW